MRKSIPIAGRSRSPDEPLPPGAAGRLFPGRGPPVGLRPPFSPRPGNSLTLIVADSHLDCRAAHATSVGSDQRDRMNLSTPPPPICGLSKGMMVQVATIALSSTLATFQVRFLSQSRTQSEAKTVESCIL